MKKSSITISKLRNFLDKQEEQNKRLDNPRDSINIWTGIFLPMFNRDTFFDSEEEKKKEINLFLDTIFNESTFENTIYKHLINALISRVNLSKDKISDLEMALENCEY